jgi:hypothetical protein
VVERKASGDFDYLWEDPADVGGLTSDVDVSNAQPAGKPGHQLKDPGDDLWDEPDDSFWDNQPDPDGYPAVNGDFDAFNNTWSFTPPPTPWYRTKQALTAIIAATAAIAAIVVSGVLLVFRGSDSVDQVTSVTPTAPPSAEPVPVATSAAPEQSLPLPPPPPPPETASPVNTAPNSSNPAVGPRPTKEPEIGVTRTPVTRAPISVAPQPRGSHRNR